MTRLPGVFMGVGLCMIFLGSVFGCSYVSATGDVHSVVSTVVVGMFLLWAGFLARRG